MLLDIRQIAHLKLDSTGILIDTPARSRKLQSINGYAENLNIWYEKLSVFRRLEFRSVEEQYTNRDGCPLIVDKLCSFIEIYYLTDEGFYNSSLSNLDSPPSLDQNKKLTALFSKLEREREFNLTEKIVNNNPSGVILGLFKIYFVKYLKSNNNRDNSDFTKYISIV